MAWRYRLVGKAQDANGDVRVAVEFFDDADPARVLHNHAFTLLHGTTKLQALARVRAYGTSVRDSLVQGESLLSDINLGNEGAVP